MTWRRSPRHLWAKKHSHFKSSASLFSKLGQEVETYAQTYLKDHILPNLPKGSLETQLELRSGNLFCRCDALLTDETKEKAYLFEIKSGNKVNKDYYVDLAFQALVLRGLERTERYFLVLLNKHYTHSSKLNLAHLFQVIEVTREVVNLEKEVANQVQQAQLVLEVDDPHTLPECDNPDMCPCPDICHPDLPEFSIYDLAGMQVKTKRELRDQGIRNLLDVPEASLTSPRQRLQKQLTRDRTAHIDSSAIDKELSSLKYPLYFLDYEACNLPIPKYPGHWSYAEVVFQFSLHKLEANGAMEHYEFLHLDQDDPSLPLINQLTELIGPEGNLVAWSKSYEMRMHNQLARLNPEHLLFLLELNQRMYDLRDVFSKGFYVDYRFKGKTSLKNVLPVLAPELNHLDLAVSKGDQASYLWYQSVFGDLSAEEIEQNRKDLLEYCQLDTLAMVRIFKHLKERISG